MTSSPTSKAKPSVTASKDAVGCETYQVRARVNQLNKLIDLDPDSGPQPSWAERGGHNSA